MAYREDIRALDKLDEVRLWAIVAAIGMLLVQVVLDLDWLDWPRAIAWSVAAVASLLAARVLKRMGRSPNGAYARAALFFLIAIFCVI